MPRNDKKMFFPDHHEHALIYENFNSKFICDGCREPGLHSGYCCDSAQCNFVLHEQCITRFGDVFSSNRFPGSSFVFSKSVWLVIEGTRGRSTINLSRCEVCAKPINGYAYIAYNPYCGYMNLHPHCATLPININNGMLTLTTNITSECIWCGYQSLPGFGNSWAYISTTPSLQIHVGCVKDMFMECSNGGNIFGGALVQGNSYLALPNNAGYSTIPSSSNSTAMVPGMQPRPSSNSTAIVPRKRDQIKKHAKTIKHAFAAVLAPAAAIASVVSAIATIIPFF